MEKVIINAKVTKDLKKAANITAAKKGITATDLIINLLLSDSCVSRELKILEKKEKVNF